LAFKKRHFPTRDKKLPKGYDSWLELNLHEGPLREAQHHPTKQDLIPYSVPHTYEYDFMFIHEDRMFVCEAKGRLRDSADGRRYHFIKDALEDWKLFKESGCSDIEFFFLFENSKTAFPFAKKRKDGTKLTHGEWSSKHGYRWLCKKRGDLEGVNSSETLVKQLEVMN
jgi:hypothetical protein